MTGAGNVRVVQQITGLGAGAWQLDAAKSGADSADAQRDATIATARYQAADAWFTALSVERQLEIANAQVASLQARADKMQAIVDAKMAIGNDLLLVELALAQAKQGVLQLDALRDASHLRLGFAIGTSDRFRPEEPGDAQLRGDPPAAVP